MTAAGPRLDAENTHTRSIPVSFDDVLMSGAPLGPEEEGDRPVSHRRRESILAGVACLVLPVPLSLLVLAVVLHVRGLL